jgi:hypothetical protein
MNHPNRASKTKNKKGSGCAMCKYFKHGVGPARKNKDVALMRETNKEALEALNERDRIR